MSEESKEEDRKGAVGGGFEQGMRNALEKAPGLAAPGWLTMQTAMAGGAAGGAAGLSWRWIVGPAVSAALIGGALWYAQPEEQTQEPDVVEDTGWSAGPEGNPSGMGWFEEEDADDAASGTEGKVMNPASETDGSDVADATSGAGTKPRTAPKGSTERGGSADGEAEQAGGIAPEKSIDGADWADLPAEKAAAFAVDVKAACVGTEIGFRMAKPLEDVRVLWNFGDGQFSSDSEPHHVFRAPGTYDITLSVTRVSDGLIRTRTIENLVTIHPMPEAEFTWEVPAVAQRTPLVRMRDRSRDAASSTWIVDGESTRDGQTAEFGLDRVGEHVVQLVASSPHGCQSVAQHSIEVGNRFGIGGSGRFSPNGDGRYDTFIPRTLIQVDRPYVFRIEDREGHIVFETTGPNAWDGMLPDGRKARAGEAFAWTVVIQGEDGPAYFSDEVLVE